MKCSMIEIYKETIRDLLEPDKENMKIKEDKNRGIYIQNLTEVCVVCEDEMVDVISHGE